MKLYLILTALTTSLASDCNVAILDDPLNFQTLYNNRGGQRASPFPEGTSNVCAYYASPDVVGDNHGACCTAAFVDNVVAPLIDTFVKTNQLSKPCLNALQRSACFACSRKQTDYLSIEYQVKNIPNSTADIKVCRSTCHTVYEHCKDDAAFQIDGEHTVSEARICAYLNDGIAAAISGPNTRIEVSVVEDQAIESPECFLYDDLTPTVTEFNPPALSLVKPSTNIFQIVFNERIQRKSVVSDDQGDGEGDGATPSASPVDQKSIQLLKILEDGTTEVVASIDATDSTSSSQIQIVTSEFQDDTLQIVFDPVDPDSKKESDKCLLDVGIKTKYSITIAGNILEDRMGNIYAGIGDQTWTFSSNPDDSCATGSGMTAVGIGVTTGVLVVLLLGGIVFFYSRRTPTANPRQYADFGDDVTVPEGPIQEGSMVTTADGAKLQVRLVPTYANPVESNGIDIGGVQEEKADYGNAV